MANCVWCGEETKLLVNGVPTCLVCDGLPQEARTKRKALALERAKADSEKPKARAVRLPRI